MSEEVCYCHYAGLLGAACARSAAMDRTATGKSVEIRGARSGPSLLCRSTTKCAPGPEREVERSESSPEWSPMTLQGIGPLCPHGGCTVRMVDLLGSKDNALDIICEKRRGCGRGAWHNCLPHVLTPHYRASTPSFQRPTLPQFPTAPTSTLQSGPRAINILLRHSH